MKVIVACEFSGIVRDAFIDCGHEAISCDLLSSESGKGKHIKGDIKDIDLSSYDLMIAHPPCTYLCRSGIRWIKERNLYKEQLVALSFVQWLLAVDIPMIALENPIGILSTHIRKPDQIVQPWMFGIHETKATCLWLKNLPCLVSTEVVYGRQNSIHNEPPSKNRSKNRSRTFNSIAQAMALQWGVVS